jgi:osmotically-inducible protein OsmY
MKKDDVMLQDSLLQRAVLAELDWEPSVKAEHIGVAVNSGVITLTGQVESYAQKHGASTAALRVKGVLAVADEIEVQVPFERRRGDTQIALAALDSLAWDVSVPPDSIQVNVEQGLLTLTGEVDRHYQREAAEQDVRRLYGVVGVCNQVSIKSGETSKNSGRDISSALLRSWYHHPDAITVSAKDGMVRLTGTVHSWDARRGAAETAWASPGTIDVENRLVVA